MLSQFSYFKHFFPVQRYIDWYSPPFSSGSLIKISNCFFTKSIDTSHNNKFLTNLAGTFCVFVSICIPSMKFKWKEFLRANILTFWLNEIMETFVFVNWFIQLYITKFSLGRPRQFIQYQQQKPFHQMESFLWKVSGT